MSYMKVSAPSLVSVRLRDDDKELYVKLHEAAENKAGIRLSQAQVYRLAMNALADKLKVK